jgi:hypothetical protein
MGKRSKWSSSIPVNCPKNLGGKYYLKLIVHDGEGFSWMEEFNYIVKTSQHLKAVGYPSTDMIIAFLWDGGWNVDSDGDEEGDEKIFQYLQTREKPTEVVIIDRLKIERNPLAFIYKISSNTEYIAAKTAYLLATVLQGAVSKSETGPVIPLLSLVDPMGQDFDLEKAFERVRASQK